MQVEAEKTLFIPLEHIWRLSVAQYHAMAQAGVLTDDDPIELLEGWLVTKMTKNPPHRIATRLTQQTLERIVPEGWYVDAQEPVTIGTSEPEPDVVVIRGNTRDYHDRHSGPDDLALVIEVADATLQRDRGIKQRIYARAKIPVYWIINLPERQLECYSDPSGATRVPAYHQRQDLALDDRVPVVIEGLEVGQIVVRDLLP
jgi:Uma2 family endonuclease